MSIDAERGKRYQKILSIIENDVVYMKRNMAVFKKLRGLVKFPEILQGTNWLLNWIVDTYTTDIAMSIRRLIDVHPDTHCQSLYKFLKELKNHCPSVVDEEELQRDIEQLHGDKNPTLKKILRFTLQDRAHSDDRSKIPEGVMRSIYTEISFDDEVFPEAERIERLFIKYYRIFNRKDPKFTEKSYVEHSEAMIGEIDDTLRRVYREKLCRYCKGE